MCGILGSLNINFNHEELSLISHRGPDSNGIIDFECNKNKIKLAQTRLAIVDLTEAGNQPMVSACGNYAITFNGEIYNHLNLRNKLTEINFKGHSDTETILYYLIKYGIDGIKDFNGIFAFCYLDLKKQKMLLVRDFFGVKPLYYSLEKNNLVFSSEIRPIIKLKKDELDLDNLASLLRLRYIPSPNTLYKNINKLRPGHYAEINLQDKDINFREYAFISELPSTKNIKYDSALLEYETKISEAVNRQLMSDVEVGILLSGGIDSAIVAALAQKHSSKKLKAFTIGFEGLYDEDEIANAKETADILGLDHYSAKMSFDDFLTIFKETIRIVEEPLATTSLIPMYFLSKLASEHVKVVLTGQGADEPLGGYQRYQGEIVSAKIPRTLIKWAGNLVNVLGIKNEKIIRASNSLGEKDDVKRFVKVYSIFNEAEIEKLLNIKEKKSYKAVNYYYQLLNCKKKKKSVERMMAIDTRMNLSDDLLIYTDKITMNFSLECRVPLLDTELINFIESLPSEFRVKRNKTKIIHKDFAKKILSEKIINRKKMGFQSPTDMWFKKYNSEIKKLLLNDNHPFARIFNLKEVEFIINQHQKGYNKEKQIFLLMGIYYWLEL